MVHHTSNPIPVVVTTPPSHSMVASLLREHFRSVWQQVRAISAGHDQALKGLAEEDLRYFEPWPDWVLKIIEEVSSVYLPRIKRETIHQILKSLHNFIFGLPIETMQIDAAELKNCIFFSLGHVEQHVQKKFEELEKLIGQTPGLSKLKKQYSEKSSKTWSRLIKSVAQINVTPAEVMEKVVEAKKSTYDENGELRSTSATEIYIVILKNWPRVEKMSGQAELTQFLDPYFGNTRSSEQKYDLVKKLCQRIGITFVKGQTNG